jgi:hypothetical protein
VIVYVAPDEVPEGGRNLPFVEKDWGLPVKQRLRRGGYERTGALVHVKAKFVAGQLPRRLGFPASLGTFDEHGASNCQASG